MRAAALPAALAVALVAWFAVADSAGVVVAHAGDVGLGAYFRSAAKPIQLLPLVESGAADRLGLAAPELAVAAASHSASPEQVAAATSACVASGGGRMHVVNLNHGVDRATPVANFEAYAKAVIA